MSSSSIAKRPGGKWRARYRDDANHEHARHFDRKVDAQRWLDEVTAAMVTGQYVDPRAGKVTFGEYAEQWAAVQAWRPKTAYRVNSSLRNHLLPTFGPRPLGAIRPTEVQALLARMSATLAPSTVKVNYSLLRQIMRAAVADRLIASSPCAGIGAPATRRRPMMVPDAATIRRISDNLPEHYAAVPFVAAGLGLRPGEVLGLTVDRVDFLRRTVSVEEQLDDQGRLVALKTAASYRTVPLPSVVADVLAAHLVGRPTTGLVFRSATGATPKRNSFEKTWRTAAARAGCPGVRLHDLRHAYASALIDAGESVKVIQERLGHASALMTLDVYGHLWPTSDDRTRAAVDTFLSAPADYLRTGAALSQVNGGLRDYLEKT